MKTLRVYIITRLFLTIPMLFVLVTLVFLVVRVMPGDPVAAMLRPGVPEEYKEQIRHSLGLDRPLFVNFRGSSAQSKDEALFLSTAPGISGQRSIYLEDRSVLIVSNRKKVENPGAGELDGDWLQLAVPKDFTGWVSPDQIAWLRQVGADMTILEEREGVAPWTGERIPENLDYRPWVKISLPEGDLEGWAPADQFNVRINPFDSQYFSYIWDLARFDLGESLAPTRGRPVIEDLKLKF
ncbi:MAG: hypothetical protein JXA42_08245, partial [Anaerolineales bacterium]|nr:hypothetical protein [Anaerolineales bacterium]